MKKERIKDLLNLEEDNLRLDETPKKGVKQQTHNAKSMDNTESKSQVTKSKDITSENPVAEPSGMTGEEGAGISNNSSKESSKPVLQQDVIKNIWQKVLITTWNKYSPKTDLGTLKEAILGMVGLAKWEDTHKTSLNIEGNEKGPVDLDADED